MTAHNSPQSSAVNHYKLAKSWFFFKGNNGVVMRTFCMVYKNGPRYRIRLVDNV
jgi:hypothetical protein